MSQHGEYVAEWAREDNPTVGMSDKAMMAHYKAHALESDIRFYLLTQAASLSLDEYHALVILSGQLSDTKKASTRKRIAQDVRAIMAMVGCRKGYMSLREAQMRLGQDMADAIDYASEAA